jgi:hypothetical protein
MEYTFKRVNLADMAPVFRVIVPLFHDAVCLIENGFFREAEAVIPHLSRYCELFPQAKQSIEVLKKTKARAMAKSHHDFQQASTLASSSSSTPSPSEVPQFKCQEQVHFHHSFIEESLDFPFQFSASISTDSVDFGDFLNDPFDISMHPSFSTTVYDLHD